jgi:hypothetical protein
VNNIVLWGLKKHKGKENLKMGLYNTYSSEHVNSDKVTEV